MIFFAKIGLLGIDTLRDHQVSIDFERGTMEVRKSEKRAKSRRVASDEIVVTAKSMFGQLIVTDAYYGSTRIQVVLDTGSQVSMGNSALRKRVTRSRKTQPIELTDVTGVKTFADYTTVPNINTSTSATKPTDWSRTRKLCPALAWVREAAPRPRLKVSRYRSSTAERWWKPSDTSRCERCRASPT